jgi:hypothetical protein
MERGSGGLGGLERIFPLMRVLVSFFNPLYPLHPPDPRSILLI